MKFTAASTFVLVAAAPSAVWAVDYQSAEQAMTSMFPEADHFESREVTLGAQQMQDLAARGVRSRSARWTLRAAMRNGVRIGWFVADEVIGKFELISYAVGIDASGAIKQVEILSYRESHGGEIRLSSWRRQFVGKTIQSPLRVGDDIASISGATLSCTHVAEGVQRIVAVVDAATRSGQVG